jgi:hypothetical protein
MIKIALALLLLALVIAHNIDRERDWKEEETDSTWEE